MLEFNVRNQSISRVDNMLYAEKSINYLEAKFNFLTEDWRDLTKSATFENKKGKIVKDAILNNDKCLVPWEVLEEKGKIEVSVYGVDINTKITTNIASFNLYDTISGGSATQDPTPDVYQQIIDMIEDIAVSGVTDEQIARAVEEYLAENPVTGVDEEEVIRIVREYIDTNKEILKGEKGDTGVQGPQGEKGDPGTDGKDGLPGKNGADGFSPSAKVEQTAEGALITITDAEGTTTAIVKNGKDGADGEDGKDGTASGSESASKWKDKALVAFGTSITYLCGNDGGYLQTVKEVLGLSSFKNYGLSGHAITYVEGKDGISRKIQSTSTASYDIVTIEGCTNDFKLNIPLGTVGKMGDGNFDDTADFCQALRKAIEHILTEKPTANILLIADMQRDSNGYDVNHVNTAGHKLIDYVNAMIEIGALYGIPVCDLYRHSGFNALTFNAYTTDGLHPNEAGFVRIGNVISSVLNNMYSTTVIINGGSGDGDDNGDNGGNGDNSGEDEGGSNTPDINTNIATIDGVDYDISVASKYAYKMIMLLSDTYYLHYSNNPFYLYNASTYSEVFNADAYRATNNEQTFSEGQLLITNNYGTEIADSNGYRRSTRNRTLANYVWTNADILYWGTENVAINSSI